MGRKLIIAGIIGLWGTLVLNSQLYAQQHAISGTVTASESGEVLPGVNIMVEGTSKGTSSDSEGNYEIRVHSLTDTLRFSFLGFQTTEVPIQGRTTVDIALKVEAIFGKELVVVGYGELEFVHFGRHPVKV